MFWVKNEKGNLVNLTIAQGVFAQRVSSSGDRWELRAVFSEQPDDWSPLVTGTAEECGKYRDHLIEKLRAHQTNLEVLD